MPHNTAEMPMDFFQNNTDNLHQESPELPLNTSDMFKSSLNCARTHKDSHGIFHNGYN